MGLSFNIATMTRPQHIGVFVKAARDDSGLTQQDVAHLADTTIDAISSIENGKRTPELSTFARLVVVLRLSPSQVRSAIEYEVLNYEGLTDEQKRELLKQYRSLDGSKE